MASKGSKRRTAAWLCLFATVTTGVDVVAATVDDATKAQLKDATSHYESGVKALDAGKDADALKEFQKSYDIVSSPNSRLMVGRVLLKLGRLSEAFRELELTLEQAKKLAVTQTKYQKTANAAQKELEELTRRLSIVHVSPGAKVTIAGKAIDLSEWQRRVPLEPGKVEILVTFSDGRKLERAVEMKAGEVVDLNLIPASEPASDGPAPDPSPQIERQSSDASLDRRTVGYVVGSVGIVGLGTFVGCGLLGASSYGDPKSDCAAGACPESSVDDSGSKSLMQGIGYTGLAVGVLGVGIGTWLLLSGGNAEPTTALHLSPGQLRMIRRF